jgi:hypothetical protein
MPRLSGMARLRGGVLGRRYNRRVVLRDLLHKLLNRDLAAQSKRVFEEKDALGKRAGDLKRRVENLERQHRRISDRRVPEFERKLDHWVAQESGSLSSAKAEGARLEAEAEEIKGLYREMDTEIAAVDCEGTRLRDDATRLTERLDAIIATGRRRSRITIQGALAVEIVGIAVAFIIPSTAHAVHRAHVVHLDYYSAVAAIMPVLLVAGFVELALFGRLIGGLWAVLIFALPSVGATAGALDVLATHRSTVNTLFLTIWGLGATTIALILYFILHAEFGRDLVSASQSQ